MNPNIFLNTYELSSYHVNLHGNLTLPMLMNFLVETAGTHADNNGFGFRHTFKAQRTWVLSGVKIKMSHLPKYLDKIHIKTWIKGTDRIFFDRHFHILDKNENVIGGAITQWASIDLKTRRPVPTEHVEHPLEYYPDMSSIDENIERLPDLENPASQGIKHPKFSDIDLNKHVTTVRYIDWLIDEYPFQFLNEHVPEKFEIQFLKEVLIDHSIQVHTEQLDAKTYLHKLIRLEDNKEVTRARVHWGSI